MQEEKVAKKVSIVRVVLISFAVIFEICLVLGFTYYFLKDRNIDLLKLNDDKRVTNNEEKEVVDNTKDGDVSENIDNSKKIVMNNSDWSVFYFPEGKVGVEIPSFNYEQKILDNDGYVKETFYWKAGLLERAEDSILDNYLLSLYVTFFPTKYPYGFGCGLGCASEHYIEIKTYKNDGKKNLDDVIKDYKKKWVETHVSDPITEDNLKGDFTNKWGTRVWSYSASFISGVKNGYIVSTDNYVYEVIYLISDEYKEAKDIANKVLDSIKFEKEL